MPFDYINTVEDTIAELEVGDIIEVKWVDACKVNSIIFNQILENRTFATYKKSLGEFHAIKADKLYHFKFVVLIQDCHNKRYTIISIPIASITAITILKKTQKLKHVTDIGVPYLTGKSIKVSR